MKKYFLISAAISAFSLSTYAQTDTLFLNNEKIACVIKEVTADAVKYSYPNEDMVNSVFKNGVEKIVFKSGRTQVFAESTSYKKVNGVKEYANVTVTAVESEVRGLYKLGDVSSKAVGTTAFANQERVKERAYRKMKIQAAMMGGNIVYLTAQRTEGNKGGGLYQSASAAETNLTGVCYSNHIPNAAEFKKLIGSRKEFATYEKFKLGGSDSDLNTEEAFLAFEIINVEDNNGIVTIEGKLEGVNKTNKFQLAGVSADHFSIFYRDKSTVYNYSIKL